MTEAEWLACDDSIEMLNAWWKQGSDRKRRLFACACCRRVWHAISDDGCRKAVMAAEGYADKQVKVRELLSAHVTADAALDVAPTEAANVAACFASSDGSNDDDQNDSIVDAAFEAANAAADPKAERVCQARIVRCLFGNPFRPMPIATAWLTDNVTHLAQAAYDERLPDGRLDNGLLAVLGDAVEEAGGDMELAAHLREPGEHWRGCWGLDVVLGKT